MYRDGDRLVVSATDLVGFLACPHYTTLSLEATGRTMVVEEDEGETALDVVARRGLEHEAAYLAKLKADGLRVAEIGKVGRRAVELAEAEAQTVRAMAEGNDVVFQATFFDQGGVGPMWRGHADFLKRVDEDPGYEPEDTKLARHVKPSALLQLCLYAAEIERLRGAAPREIHVVLGGQVHASFATQDLAAYFRHARGRFVAALEGPAATTYPMPCDHCAVCRYAPACDSRREADDHLSLVANLTREQATKLERAGVSTVVALGATSDGLHIKGIGADALVRLRRQARLQVAGRAVPEAPPPVEVLPPSGRDRGLEALPLPSPGDPFFDMEGDPDVGDGGLEYLFGVGWREPDGAFGFRAFWGHDPAAEKAAFEGFLDLVAERRHRHPDLHVYHYAPYEPTALGKLMGRHATREAEVDDLLRNRVMVDLYKIVRQSIAVGSPSYSIKKLEPLYMEARDGAITDAGSSIVEYERWLESRDPKILADLEAYNRDDCVSTAKLRDWLEGRRADAEKALGIALSRPAAGEVEAPDGVAEEDDASAALIARLTAGQAGAPLETDRESYARWLVAQLVGWHRREAKPEWWRYFSRVLDCSDADLVDDSEAIGELDYVGVVETIARSNVHRYRFPPQELKLGVGTVPEDPASKRAELQDDVKVPGPGTIHGIDLRAGTVDLKRSKTSKAPHPRSLVPPGPIDSRVLRKAVAWLAGDIAERGIDADGPGRAVRDLLLRRSPRIRGVAAGTPLFDRAREPDGVEIAKRLALGLDRSTLAIQGPPGSGKTHASAHVLLALVRAGHKVGITANSHAVIGNVLSKLVEVAGGAGLRILQKADEDDACDAPGIELAAKSEQVEAALAAGEVDVVAGTAWLFAREGMRGRLDYLLVDEAGQLSLANVVAIGGAATNLILVGDPQQLPQPGKGSHPPGVERSALEYVLAGAPTIPDERGLFLDRTHRLHPTIASFVSELSYAGRLRSVDGCARQAVAGGAAASGSGLRWAPVSHEGNRTSSTEEVSMVGWLVGSLLGRDWTDARGKRKPLGLDDVLVVAPYNAHVHLLAEALPAGARVGTVDKFQGQEAAVVIVAMAASSAADVPRGMEFLFSRNRLNVAVSRARALSVLVASPTLLAARCRTVEQLRLVNGLCRFVEQAEEVALPRE